MNAKEALVVAAILIIGAALNFLYPVAAGALSVPVGIEFVIVAYCLVVVLLPLRLPEVIAIGVISGILNIVSNTYHVAIILGGQAATPAGMMAFVNLVSEPAGIVVCFFAFTYLGSRARTFAPCVAAFTATIASGVVYLLMVLLLDPSQTAGTGFFASFLTRVLEAAVAACIVVQLVFMAASRPVKVFLEARDG